MIGPPKGTNGGSAMRLSTEDIAIIRALVQARFGASSRIWLFGSRLDDGARGGDVDLYVEPGALPNDNLLLARQALQRDLERRLRQPMDLVVNPGHTTAFMRQAREEGRLL
jgi:predicted nucleotidyltransferase